MIYIENKRKSSKTLENTYPNALIIDVTSKGEAPWVKLSPFYPHGNIPIPYSPGHFAECVEGIWQGLKVFESQDIDPAKFEVTNMKGIKRTVRKYGKPLGHRKGVNGNELLDYLTARREIYLRAYAWVLENEVQDVVQLLKDEAQKRDVVLLDYDTNNDIDNPKKPLSHASLVKRYLEKKYPELTMLTFGILNESKGEYLKKPKNNKRNSKKTKKANITSDLQSKLW